MIIVSECTIVNSIRLVSFYGSVGLGEILPSA